MNQPEELSAAAADGQSSEPPRDSKIPADDAMQHASVPFGDYADRGVKVGYLVLVEDEEGDCRILREGVSLIGVFESLGAGLVAEFGGKATHHAGHLYLAMMDSILVELEAR
jgi:hypothetical protein